MEFVHGTSVLLSPTALSTTQQSVSDPGAAAFSQRIVTHPKDGYNY